MARFIFLATVLVALCYTSQAFPTSSEIRDKIREELEERWKNVLDKKEKLFDKIKELKDKNIEITPDELGEQYILGNFLPNMANEVNKITNTVFDAARGITKEALDASQKIVDSILSGKDKRATQELLPQVANIFTEAGEAILNKIKDIQEKIDDLPDSWKDILNNILNGVGGRILDEIMEKEKEIINKINEILGN